MSSPTGPEQNYPQGGAPQGQPDWNAPQQPAPGYGPPPQQPAPGYNPAPQQPAPGYNPAPQYSGAPAGYGAPGGQRPSQVSTAAIIGVVIGGIGTLFGLLALVVIGTLFTINALLGIFALLSIATAVVVLIGGIQVLRGQAPRLLLLGSYASIAIQLLYLILSISTGYGFSFSAVLGFILPGVIVFLLMQPQSKQYFASRGQSY